MLEKYCDILVIGTELPGLITAAFLARRGLSVQVLEPDFFASHSALPDPICLTSVHSKLLRSILGRLNVSESAIQNFLSLESSLQVILPKQRIDIHADVLAYAEELDREFPEQYATLKNFYEELARVRHETDVNEFFDKLLPHSWRDWFALKKYIRDHRLSESFHTYKTLTESHPLLRCFLEVQYLLGHQSRCAEPLRYQIAELFNPGDGEIFSVIHGQKPLIALLLDRIQHHDGHVRNKTSVSKLLYRNGILEGAELGGSQDSILAKYVLWNAPMEKLAEVLPHKWKFRHLKKYSLEQKPSYHWFTFRFEIPQNLKPEPMQPNCVLITNPDQPLTGDNLVYVQSRPVPGKEKFFLDANILMSASALDEEPSFFTPYWQRLQSLLHHLMPFTEGHLRPVFPMPPDTLEGDTLFPVHENDFEIFKHSAKRHGVWEQNGKDFSALFPLDFRTPCSNFFISHPDVFRALGLESKLMLGLKITDLIWQEAEKEKKRAMKSERRIA